MPVPGRRAALGGHVAGWGAHTSDAGQPTWLMWACPCSMLLAGTHASRPCPWPAWGSMMYRGDTVYVYRNICDPIWGQPAPHAARGPRPTRHGARDDSPTHAARTAHGGWALLPAPCRCAADDSESSQVKPRHIVIESSPLKPSAGRAASCARPQPQPSSRDTQRRPMHRPRPPTVGAPR